MAEYWLISAPGDKTMQQTWETMNNVTSKQNNLCVNYKFHIPDLKVSNSFFCSHFFFVRSFAVYPIRSFVRSFVLGATLHILIFNHHFSHLHSYAMVYHRDAISLFIVAIHTSHPSFNGMMAVIDHR